MFAKLSFAFEVESPSYLKEDLRKPERVKIVILLKKRQIISKWVAESNLLVKIGCSDGFFVAIYTFFLFSPVVL